MVISAKDKEAYAEQGFLVLREAFAKTRLDALLEAVEGLIDKGLAGECELGWIDRERRLPSRTSHLLDPDKYHPVFADWIDEDLAPHLEALIRGPGVRHSLFGMLASGGGDPYTQKWHLGRNPEGRKRWTMHCTFWHGGATVMTHEYGQRDSLTRPGHLGRMPPITRRYIQSYLDNYPEADPPSLLDL